MHAHERRITKVEKTISHSPAGGFQGSIRPVNLKLDGEDPKLKAGVTEFEYVFPPESVDPDRKETRGLGFISPWCSVEFWDGGNKKTWNLALKGLRQVDTFFKGYGVISTLSFDGDGKCRPGGILFMQFSPKPTKDTRTA